MKQEKQKTYIAIDLKSFYASVECCERNLNPMTTNLVVADVSRTEKTICLAVSPSLKAYGIPGRARLFEVVQKVKEVNRQRLQKAPGHRFTGSATEDTELKNHPEWRLDYITAPPRMALYLEKSTEIYHIYLKYIAPEDIHVYSIDEVMMDVTHYLGTYGMTARELAAKIMQDIYETVGMTATAGIGTNLYLCKVAMDIVAKHMPADEHGARVAELDEFSYRRLLWEHQPITDFWRVGRGYAKKLADYQIYTMGDVARCSIGKETDFYNEELLYRLFGINAELLIDHAWGWEPVGMEEIKRYKPENNSICSGMVLQCAYDVEKARLVMREMTDLLSLDLVEKGLVTDQLVLTVGYDIENLIRPELRKKYHGPVTTDHYGRKVPKHAHGTENLKHHTASARLLIEAAEGLYDRIMQPDLLVRRITLTANHVITEKEAGEREQHTFEQMDLFTDYEAREKQQAQERAELEKEKKMQQAMLDIKKKFGKNAILKGMNLEEGAVTRQRNNQIGGHKA